MIGWIYRMIIGHFGCEHTYEIISEGKMIGYGNEKCGDFYNLQCKKCGKIKRTNTSIYD